MRTRAALLGALMIIASPARASEAGHEFVMSCTYGAVAGTIVGVASLAFTKHPGDNLNHVARGASLGLYAGILLGGYVTLIVPRLHRGDDDLSRGEPPLVVAPLVADGGLLDGAEVRVNLLDF